MNQEGMQCDIPEVYDMSRRGGQSNVRDLILIRLGTVNSQDRI
jgi:hypothetical protein